MRSISPALNTFLAGDVLTFATCVMVTRTDGQIFGFIDHDADLIINGVTYSSSSGYSASAIESSSNLSTSNLEIDGLFIDSGGAVQQSDIEAGIWSNAAVLIFAVNYADLTQGQVNLTSGNLGRWTVQNGGWKVELRGLAQTMQQTVGKQFSATCRNVFGDANCTVNLAPLTVAGSVSSIVTPGIAWNDPTLTQTGPSSQFSDTVGHLIPTATPYQVQAVPPSGTFLANTSVVDGGGRIYAQVGSSPGEGQYTVTSSGLYTFSSQDSAQEVFINFTYAVGYFSYGKVVWTGGANAGYTSPVRMFSPGVVTLGLPVTNAMAVGDTYNIVAGCDRQYGTCSGRYGNIVNFGGEPFIPGPDVLLAPQAQ